MFILGVPDAPYDVSVRVNNNFLDTAWDYHRIETVEVTLTIFLIFSEPSKLLSSISVVVNKNFFNFILEDNESCDPFSLCITGNNSVGQGNTSCINGYLPYVPSEDMISYSLSPDQGSYILSVSVTVSCYQ